MSASDGIQPGLDRMMERHGHETRERAAVRKAERGERALELLRDLPAEFVTRSPTYTPRHDEGRCLEWLRRRRELLAEDVEADPCPPDCRAVSGQVNHSYCWKCKKAGHP